MKELINSIFKTAGQTGKLLTEYRGGKNISAFGLQFGERTLFAAAAKPCVYVCSDSVAAAKAMTQFEALDVRAVLLTGRDDVLSYHKLRSQESAFKRVSALTEIVTGRAEVIVVNPEALIQLYPNPEIFKRYIQKINKGDIIEPSELCAKLIECGYKREAQVTAKGQFSLRGDILDIMPPNADSGVRIEFFGDTVDCIKLFDADDQTAKEEQAAAEICPASEVFYDNGDIDPLLKRLKESISPITADTERTVATVSQITLSLAAGERCASLAVLAPLLNSVSFNEFVRPVRIIIDEAKQTADNLTMLYTEHENRYKTLFSRGETLKCAYFQFIERDNVFKTDAACLAFNKLDTPNRLFKADIERRFNSVAIPDYTRNYEKLADDLNTWLSGGYRIVIFAGNERVKENLEQLFDSQRVGANTGGEGYLNVLTSCLPYGGIFHDDKLVLIGTDSIVVKAATKRLKRAKGGIFTQPTVGSYVVHNIHGIGFCEAVKRLEMNGAGRDYLVISYRGGDKLYVPVENMDSLSLFAAGESEPKLNKIGGADFERVKEKVRASVKKLAFSLVDLYAQRKEANGYRYSEPDSFFTEFCDAFPHSETDDQLEAVEDGIRDLTEGRIMDRLLCGDVGYGKTEVALRLAFKVITDGKQAAFVAPTTVLARQQLETIKKRMLPFGVRVGSLTRFDSEADIKKTLSMLKSGELDIVAGTHRVLSADVEFKDLGLLILDEEQRFGVEDKEKIKKLKVNVNVFTLSATPIPRTLHMSLSGIRDISILDTPPQNRIPVQTYVTEYADTLIADAVTRELNRGGQVFIVYNRVETIDRFAASVAAIIPSAKIAVAHGQMKEDALERTVVSFISGEKDVLIATTIIENGIDMPNANTMIVIDSDRFGLAQLYQLRGRVGRADRLAYVYFTFDPRKVLTQTAYRRLDAITEYTEFGSGFKIAMRDLEIRGAGNILGAQQHGHIEQVGYDMYVKLLENAVKELSGDIKGESGAAESGGDIAEREKREIKVITDFNAFIPETYISDNDWRLKAYAAVSRISTNAERIKMSKDLAGIYGKPPASVDNLLTIALVKNLALKVNASKVTLKRDECRIGFEKISHIPPIAAKAAQNRLNPRTAIIDFGSSRQDMISFLSSFSE